MAATVSLRLDFAADVESVRVTLLEFARTHPLCIDDPEPDVELVDADDAGITVRLTAWAADQPDAGKLGAALRERVVKEIAQAGVPLSAQRVRLVDRGDAVEG
jgi:small-conductance mechanosensitive channel